MTKKKDEIKIENDSVIDEEKIIKEIKAKAFVELKEEIDDYVEKEASKVVMAVNRKILREKNRKILCKDLIIVLLILVHFVFLYCLYNNIKMPIIDDLIDKNRTDQCEDKCTLSDNNDAKNDEVQNVDDEYNLDYYIEKYGFLLEKIRLNTKNYEQFFGDFDRETLSNDIKLNLAYGLLSQEKISVNGSFVMVKEEALRETFATLFGPDESFKNENFMVGNTEMVYSENISTYIGLGDDNENRTIIYKIIYIEEKGDTVSLTFKVGIFYDNNVYDLQNNLIKENSNEILDSDNLDSYTCSFSKKMEDYIFTSIRKDKE